MSDIHWNEIKKIGQSVLNQKKADEEHEKNKLESMEIEKNRQGQILTEKREAQRLKFEKEKWGDLRQASKIVVDVLESVQKNNPMIVSSKFSRIEINEFGGERDDYEKGVAYKNVGGHRGSGRFAPVTNVYYKKEEYTIQHILQWGAKLGITDDEKRIISTYNPFSFKAVFAPSRILQSDWYSITIDLKKEIKENNIKYFIVSSSMISIPDSNISATLLYPQIAKSLISPARYVHWLEKEKRYSDDNYQLYENSGGI